MKRHGLFWAFAAMLWLWTAQGCGESNSCRTDLFCAKGQICQAGVCTKGCRTSFDCAKGEACVANACGPESCTPGQSRACYEGQDGTKGKGRCSEGIQVCLTGGVQWSPCIDQILPRPEVCDREDNDCNGKVDDGIDCSCSRGQSRRCFSFPPGALDVGICRAGRQFCSTDNLWSECFAQIRPSKELCDQLDNNCNGLIDEYISCDCEAGASRKCYVGPEDTLDKGVCRAGSQSCGLDNRWGKCTGQSLPIQESDFPCDGLDNDCNGKVDDRDPCGPGMRCEKGACVALASAEPGPREPPPRSEPRGEPGVRPEPPRSEPRAEPPRNEPGSEPRNEPRPEPVTPDGGRFEARPEPGPKPEPKPEVICTQSQTRACPVPPPTTNTSCKFVQTCLAGQWGPCLLQTTPGKEICNGVDDDCDGFIDEHTDLTPPGPCANQKGACKGSVPLCVGGTWTTHCGAREYSNNNNEYQAKETLCDGIDNDCDGIPDPPSACGRVATFNTRDNTVRVLPLSLLSRGGLVLGGWIRDARKGDSLLSLEKKSLFNIPRTVIAKSHSFVARVNSDFSIPSPPVSFAFASVEHFEIKATATDKDDNVYVTGRFAGVLTLGAAPKTVTLRTFESYSSTSSTDIFVAKFDAIGRLQWAISAGWSNGETPYSIAVDSSKPAGRVCITGSFNTLIKFASGKDLAASGASALVACFDAKTGAHQWADSIPAPQHVVSLLRNTDPTIHWIPLTIRDTAQEKALYFASNTLASNKRTLSIYKWDLSGKQGSASWAQPLQITSATGKNLGIQPNAISVTAAGRVVLAGTVFGAQTVGSKTLTPPTDPRSLSAGLVLSFDDNKKLLWHRFLHGTPFPSGTPRYQGVNGLTLGSAGEAYLCGHFSGRLTLPKQPQGTTQTQTLSALQTDTTSVFLVKLDANGALTWARKGGVTVKGFYSYCINLALHANSGWLYILGHLYHGGAAPNAPKAIFDNTPPPNFAHQIGFIWQLKHKP